MHVCACECVYTTHLYLCVHTVALTVGPAAAVAVAVDDDEQAQWHEQAVRGSSNNIKQQWRLQRQVCTLFCNLASHTSTWTCVDAAAPRLKASKQDEARQKQLSTTDTEKKKRSKKQQQSRKK